jgi:hypothetical protein
MALSMDSYRDPDDIDDLVEVPKKSRFGFMVGLSLIVFSLVSSTLAANITLNSGQRKEFGSGLYLIKSCDQWVQIYLASNGTTVQNVQLQGLDVTTCANSNIQIKLYGNSGVLNMYNWATSSGVKSAKNALNMRVVRSQTRSTAVSLIDPTGLNIGRFDDWLYLSYSNKNAQNTDDALYIVDFTEPLATASAVTRITIESAPAP